MLIPSAEVGASAKGSCGNGPARPCDSYGGASRAQENVARSQPSIRGQLDHQTVEMLSLTGDRVSLAACLADKPVSNRKNRRKTRGYCGPCVPLALLIYQTQKRSWIVKAAFQATFCEATLSQPNSRRHEPEDSGGGGKGFRKNFKGQFHARFPQRAVPVGEQPAL
jgi:hypothetical protein